MQHGAIGIGAKDDVAELLGSDQTALRAHRVSELLTRGTGSPPIWPAGFTLFCDWMALMTSVAVTPSLAS